MVINSCNIQTLSADTENTTIKAQEKHYWKQSEHGVEKREDGREKHRGISI